MATVVTSTGKGPGGQRVEVGGARAETAHGLGVATWRYGDPVLGFADVDAGGVGVADLECFGEQRRLRERRGRGTRFRESVFMGCHSSLQE